MPTELSPKQPAINQFLSNAFKRNQLAHGLIFAGPEGSSKAQTAMALARLLLCLDPIDASACNLCSSCKQLNSISFEELVTRVAENLAEKKPVHESLAHPDFHLACVSKNSREITVDVARYIQHEAESSAMLSPRKIFIILEAHRMNQECSNTLLKTLEEPPGDAHFILTVTSAEQLLPTVLSRSQVLHFQDIGGNVSTAPEALVKPFRAGDFDALAIAIKEDAELSSRKKTAGEKRLAVISALQKLARINRDCMVSSCNPEKAVTSNASLFNIVALGTDELVQAQSLLVKAQEELSRNVKTDLVLDGLIIELKHLAK